MTLPTKKSAMPKPTTRIPIRTKPTPSSSTTSPNQSPATTSRLPIRTKPTPPSSATTSNKSPTPTRLPIRTKPTPSSSPTASPSQPPTRARLDRMPVEILNQIYFHLLPHEQPHSLTWPGKTKTTTQSPPTTLCLPLTAIRPPPLLRVCRVLRSTYLPYFFQHTHFRINARVGVQKFEVGALIPGRLTYVVGDFADKHGRAPAGAVMDRSARAWLKSLRGMEGLTMRHVQFRPVSVEGEAIGLTLDVEYDAKRRTYHMQRTVDDGWFVDYSIAMYDQQAGGDRMHGTFLAMLFLQDRCWESGSEALTLDAVLELEQLFGNVGLGRRLQRSGYPDGEPYRRDYPWSAIRDWEYWTRPLPERVEERLLMYL